MRIIRNFPYISDTPLVLTIGNYDGVHLGHRDLIDKVCRQAALSPPAAAALMTFEPHPLAVLRPHQPLQRIDSCRSKLELLRQCGLDMVFMPRFNHALAALSAEMFADILFRHLQVRHLFVGENFRFGNGGRGDVALLRQCAAAANAAVTAVSLLHIDGLPASSGRVRDCLWQGDFAAAERLLGRGWKLYGRVQRGDARGRELGFPTANLTLPFTPPLRGIFAARATVADTTYPAAVSIGVNPTVNDDDRIRVEAHLLDFSGDIYGQRLSLQLLQKLRDEKKYQSMQQLVAAIADDVEQTRRIAR